MIYKYKVQPIRRHKRKVYERKKERETNKRTEQKQRKEKGIIRNYTLKNKNKNPKN